VKIEKIPLPCDFSIAGAIAFVAPAVPAHLLQGKVLRYNNTRANLLFYTFISLSKHTKSPGVRIILHIAHCCIWLYYMHTAYFIQMHKFIFYFIMPV